MKPRVKIRKPKWRAAPQPGAQKASGRMNHSPANCRPKLEMEDRVLVALEYWREDRTYFQIGRSWGLSASTVCRLVDWVEDSLSKAGGCRWPGKQQLGLGVGKPAVGGMDVTATPIEHARWGGSGCPPNFAAPPQRRQRQFFSGKKQPHPRKCPLVIEPSTGRVRGTFFGQGRRQDFKLLTAAGVHFHPHPKSLPDKGEPGRQQLHLNRRLPKKPPRGDQLGADDKAKNRPLARERVVIEHVNRYLKIFGVAQSQNDLMFERYQSRFKSLRKCATPSPKLGRGI